MTTETTTTTAAAAAAKTTAQAAAPVARVSYDPVYEFEAPRFRDFEASSDEDEQVDNWFGKQRKRNASKQHSQADDALLYHKQQFALHLALSLVSCC
jgi:hypothetical protein